MLTRIYGIAFSNKQDWTIIWKWWKRRKKRPQEIGQRVGTFYDFRRSRQRFAIVGSPTALSSAKNWRIICYAKELEQGYKYVYTPILAHKKLYENFRTSRSLTKKICITRLILRAKNTTWSRWTVRIIIWFTSAGKWVTKTCLYDWQNSVWCAQIWTLRRINRTYPSAGFYPKRLAYLLPKKPAQKRTDRSIKTF